MKDKILESDDDKYQLQAWRIGRAWKHVLGIELNMDRVAGHLRDMEEYFSLPTPLVETSSSPKGSPPPNGCSSGSSNGEISSASSNAGTEVSSTDVEKVFGVSLGWLYLTIKRPEKYPVAPIALGPAETAINVEKFGEITIKDIIETIHKKNHGHRHYWGIHLIEEKIAKLALCGVHVEIRSIV